MTQSTTQAMLSEHYKAIRARLGDNRTPARPIIPRNRIRPEPEPEPESEPEPITKHAPRPVVIRRPAASPVTTPPPSPNARRYVHVLHDVATRYGLAVESLTGKSRARSIVPARHEACYLLRAAGYSLPQIGQFLGNRDHTTALHGVQQHEKRLKREGKL